MAAIEYEKELRAEETGIPGLVVVELPVHGDNRGWFKENWQREKMAKGLGLPDLAWVQNNVSYNLRAGATRGIHAEPWNKFISVATGSVFGAWVDLRAGSPAYGKVYTCVLDPSRAIFVPRGVGNSYQALEDGTAYTYLVDAHWSAELKKTYTFVNLADPDLAIPWPIPLGECELSEADRHHPLLRDVVPMRPKRTLVTGCNGQLGRAVCALAEERGLSRDFDFCDIDTFDMSDPEAYGQYDWSLYDTVINCGAYTAVDRAETPEGRVACWKANATGPALLSRMCIEHGITLVHISSDYVFDGTREIHTEDEPLSPLGVYGQSKAAGDLVVSCCPRHYILRSSWMVGDGRSFVKIMSELSDYVAAPMGSLECICAADDQIGRLTFVGDAACAILYLLGYRNGSSLPTDPAPYGTYNLTGSGEPASRADIAREVFELRNGNGAAVIPVSTDECYVAANRPVAPRPASSTLDISKIEATGYAVRAWKEDLIKYLNQSRF